MKVLAFRHVPFEGVGTYRPRAARSAASVCDYADLYREGAPDPDIAAYDGLIFLGGPMSANDPLPYLDRERALIAQAVERGQPLLGICLGSQLIARSLGADVHRNAEKEIGWFDLHFTEAAADDALFRRNSGPGDGVPLALATPGNYRPERCGWPGRKPAAIRHFAPAATSTACSFIWK